MATSRKGSIKPTQIRRIDVAKALGATHVPGNVPPYPWQPKVNWPEIQRLLHQLWGKAHDGPQYDKEEWKLLQRLLEEAEAADPNK